MRLGFNVIASSCSGVKLYRPFVSIFEITLIRGLGSFGMVSLQFVADGLKVENQLNAHDNISIYIQDFVKDDFCPLKIFFVIFLFFRFFVYRLRPLQFMRGLCGVTAL
jgi:hypothetical protein